MRSRTVSIHMSLCKRKRARKQSVEHWERHASAGTFMLGYLHLRGTVNQFRFRFISHSAPFVLYSSASAKKNAQECKTYCYVQHWGFPGGHPPSISLAIIQLLYRISEVRNWNFGGKRIAAADLNGCAAYGIPGGSVLSLSLTTREGAEMAHLYIS